MIEVWRKELVDACMRVSGYEDDLGGFLARLEKKKKDKRMEVFPPPLAIGDPVKFAMRYMDEIRLCLQQFHKREPYYDLETIANFSTLRNPLNMFADVDNATIDRILRLTKKGKKSAYYEKVMETLAWFAFREVAKWFEEDEELREIYGKVSEGE